jgi:[acyl-carrier-protein] S-malonyltransferase/trans-AT polyketide synthase/acyltransferase/oxidoreductase domain-containing protein
MGRDFAERFPVSGRVFDEASDALGLDLRRLCFDDDARLGLTEYAQPAILTTEIAMWRALEDAFGLRAARFGGHSLGEYTALVAAGVIPLADAVVIVRERGRLMQQAVPPGRGAMVAVIGDALSDDAIAEATAYLTVTIANDNAPTQVVLSGLTDHIATAASRLTARGDLPPVRVVPLDVSAPFHSPLMAPIESPFAGVLQQASARWRTEHATKVTSNLSGGFHDAEPDGLRARLVRQVSGTVRWRANMAALLSTPTRLLEIGPGRPLRGFFKAIGVAVASITDLRSAERALAVA